MIAETFHLSMPAKPIKPAVPKATKPIPLVRLEFEFVKNFIERGLKMNHVEFTSTVIEGDAGSMQYLLTDDGYYAFWSVVAGVFEGWMRNNGGFHAALQEGFDIQAISNTDIKMGLPIWMELAGPEQVVNFLSGDEFRYILDGKELTRKAKAA